MEDLFMGTSHLNRLVGCYEQIFNELYMADTIVNITILAWTESLADSITEFQQSLQHN